MASAPTTARDDRSHEDTALVPDRPHPHGDHDPQVHAARRRAAEAAAQAAEARAASAAAEAKAAIAAAARAAAAADAAAAAAEEAEARVRAAVAAEARARAAVPPAAAVEATIPVGLPARPAPRAEGWRTPPLPEQRPASAGPHPADGGRPDEHADSDAAGATARRSVIEVDDAGAPGPASAAARHAAAETAVLAPLPADPVPADPAVDAVDDAAGSATNSDTGSDTTSDTEHDTEHDAEHADGDPGEGPATPDDDQRPARARSRRAASPAPPARRSHRRAAARRDDRDDRGDRDGAPAGRAARRRSGRRPSRPVLVAAVAVGVLAVAGLALGSAVVGGGSPQPAAVVETAPPAVPALPGAAAEALADAAESEAELTERTVVYLRELREAGVPTSRAGVAETSAAELVCEELADGVDAERIARALPASLPTVSRSQAADLVEVAEEHFCA